MSQLKWFYSFLKKYRFFMFSSLFMSTLIVVSGLINPWISGSIVDDVIYNGEMEKLLPLVVMMLFITALICVFRYCYQLASETASQGVLFDMRNALYRKLLQEDFAFYNKNRTGDLMNRQTSDMEAIRHFVAYTIPICYQFILYFVFALTMIFSIEPRLALAMLIPLPLTALNAIVQFTRMKPSSRLNHAAMAVLNSAVQENISGNRVVRAFAKEDFEIEKFSKGNDSVRDALVSYTGIWRWFVPIFETLAHSLTIILMLYGGMLAIRGNITVGNLVTVNGYLWMLSSPLRMIGWRINEISNFTAAIERVYYTYTEEPAVKMPSRAIAKKRYNGGVEFCNVSYQADDEVIVKDINFRVEPGQTVGIIGSTGSGKTTIMNLLCRFYDATSGQVKIDNTDVRKLNLYNMRDNIGMAMQDVFLFSDTIRGNIAYGRPNCTFDEIKQAAIMSDANHFIKDLPEGYDTIIGERGVGLSGGQKQRISLARALLKTPSILILDDTTSAVDMETESYIQKQLKNINKACTIFVIAYRISSVKDADLILVMDNGRIIERGTHQELLKQKGYYAKTFYNQYGEIPAEITKQKEVN